MNSNIRTFNKHKIPVLDVKQSIKVPYIGKYFEELIIPQIKRTASIIFGGSVKYRKSTDTEDIHLGTDFFLQDIPIDVTVSFMAKTYMIKSGITLRFDDSVVSFGLRCRTRRFPFKVPVLVIGFWFKDNLYMDAELSKTLVDIISPHIGEIIHTGFAWYRQINETEDMFQMSKFGRININDNSLNPLVIKHEQVSCNKDMVPIYRVTTNDKRTLHLTLDEIVNYSESPMNRITLYDITRALDYSCNEDQFWEDMVLFLYHFYMDISVECFRDRPSLMRLDLYVFMEALVEYLCRENNLTLPTWVIQDVTRLNTPAYFSSGEGLEKVYIKYNTPEEFSKRNIFIANNLITREFITSVYEKQKNSTHKEANVTFYGKTEHKLILDNKGRLQLPPNFLRVLKNPDKCAYAFIDKESCTVLISQLKTDQTNIQLEMDSRGRLLINNHEEIMQKFNPSESVLLSTPDKGKTFVLSKQ